MTYQHKSLSLKRIVKAAGYSMDGFKAAFKDEAAFRLEIILLVILLPLVFFVTEDNVERAVLWGALILVPIVEILNTAVEAAIDRISDERHQLSKKAKDTGSAAVFLSIVNAVIVWLFILV